MTPLAFPVDRPEISSAASLASDGRLCRLTPYWRVGCLAASPAAQQAWRILLPLAKHRQPPVWTVAILVLGVLPYLGFTVWMLMRVREVATIDIQWRMWLAGLWILISPGLIVAWERRFIRLHSALLEAADYEGWNVGRLVAVDRVFARLWWPMSGVASTAIVIGYVTGLGFLQRSLGAAYPPSPYFWLGLITTAMLGVSFGVGVWGVTKTLVYAWVALDSQLSLDPFRPSQPVSFEELSTTTYWTGLLYSMGSIVLPGMFAIIGQLPLAGQAIAILLAACLVLGGAAVFVLPSLWMSRVSGELTVRALDPYAAVLNQLSALALTPHPADRAGRSPDYSQVADQVAAVSTLRALVASEPTSPSALWIGSRMVTIFIVPILIGLLQTSTGIG
jgi:hypothetical protein